MPLVQKRLHVVRVLTRGCRLFLQGIGLLLAQLLQAFAGDLSGLALGGQAMHHVARGGIGAPAASGILDFLQVLDVLVELGVGAGSGLRRRILVLAELLQSVGHTVVILGGNLPETELVEEVTTGAEIVLHGRTEVIQTVLKPVKRSSLIGQCVWRGLGRLVERFDLGLAFGHMLGIRAESRTGDGQTGCQSDAGRTAERTHQHRSGIGGDGLQPAQRALHGSHARTNRPDTLRGTGSVSAEHNGTLGGKTRLRTGLRNRHGSLLRLRGHLLHALGGGREHAGHIPVHHRVTGQISRLAVAFQTRHRRKKPSELDFSAVNSHTQLAQRVLILHRALNILQSTGLQSRPSGLTGTAERHPQAQHALNRSGQQLRKRLAQRAGRIGDGLNRRGSGLQRVRKSTAERLRQLPRHTNKTRKHRRCGCDARSYHAQTIANITGERADATRSAGSQLRGVGHEITGQLTKIRHRTGKIVPRLVRRTANIRESVTDTPLGIPSASHPSAQRILSAHGIDRTVCTLQHAAELLDAILVLGNRSERTLRDTLQRAKGRAKITSLLLDFRHGLVNAVGVVHHVLGPLGEPRRILAQPLRELRQILAADHADMGQCGNQGFGTGNEIVHRLVHTVENRRKLVRLIGCSDGVHQTIDYLALMLGEIRHLRDQRIAYRVRRIHDGGLRLAVERILHVLGKLGELRVGEVDLTAPRLALVAVDHLERSEHRTQAGQRCGSGISGLGKAYDALAQAADGTCHVHRTSADIRQYGADKR